MLLLLRRDNLEELDGMTGGLPVSLFEEMLVGNFLWRGQSCGEERGMSSDTTASGCGSVIDTTAIVSMCRVDIGN